MIYGLPLTGRFGEQTSNRNSIPPASPTHDGLVPRSRRSGYPYRSSKGRGPHESRAQVEDLQVPCYWSHVDVPRLDRQRQQLDVHYPGRRHGRKRCQLRRWTVRWRGCPPFATPRQEEPGLGWESKDTRVRYRSVFLRRAQPAGHGDCD